MNRQFDNAPLVCPCCGHVIGEQAYFQTFEVKTAKWIEGIVAPPATKGYDVYNSVHFPDLTFQVKYSQASQYKGSKSRYPAISWRWTVKILDPIYPDFFILFGIDLAGKENCFLLSRNDFVAYANHASDGRYYLNVSAKEHSDRQNYNYRPKIWRYYVSDPINSLPYLIDHYQDQHLAKRSMIFDMLYEHKDDISSLRAQGLSQKTIALQYHVAQGTLQRFLKWLDK